MKFIATVEENELSRIHEIASNLKDMGANIGNVLKFTGTITGSSKNMDLNKLKIAGIKSVEVDGKVGLRSMNK